MNVAEILSARLIGTMFVERGLLSESQIRVALEIQRETGQQLGQVLVDRFGITRQELASVVAEQWADIGKSTPAVDTAANESWRRLGEIFVERGFVTQEQLDQALERQRETGERVGEALVAQGSISKFELAGALAEQQSALEAEERSQGAPTAEANVVRFAPRVAELETEPAVGEAMLEVVPEATEDAAPDAEVEPAAEPEREAKHELEPALAGAMPDVSLDVEPEAKPEAETIEDAPDAEVEPAVDPEPAPGTSAEAEPEREDGPDAEPDSEPEDLAEPTAGDDAVPLHPERPFDPVRLRHEPWEQAAHDWMAFASTTAGYRLVEGSGPLPDAGSTLDLPEVGELVVLRVGRMPLPHDHRACVFLEQVARHEPALAG